MAEKKLKPKQKQIVRGKSGGFAYKGLKVKAAKIKFGLNQKIGDVGLVKKFLKEVMQNPPSDNDAMEKQKRAFAKVNEGYFVTNREMLELAKREKMELPPLIQRKLQKRAVRTISGVSPIGILTKAYPCPGKCVYCPTEDRMPKSYMSNQPAAARALRNKFQPYRQVRSRMLALQQSGHPVSKLEVIVMGGTWSFLPHRYQSWYVKRCYDAANCFAHTHDKDFKPPVHYTAKNLKEAQAINEKSEKRIIGLTLETRPDFINERELIRMRRYGCTRIEIGVQTLNDDVSRLTKRGHYKSHVVRAQKLMKDFGFKICWHLMPGLPGSNPEIDLAMMKEVFEDEDCRPDFIKIYPCVVLETAELKAWWQDGRYKPYEDDEIARLLVKFKPHVPEYCRIMRLMRDIPVTNILGGAKFSNLRQIFASQPEKLKEVVGEEYFNKELVPLGFGKGKSPSLCKCIRCKEVGFKKYQEIQHLEGEKPFVPVLKRRNYNASGGQEVFLSFESEDEKTLFALLRLRKPSGQTFGSFGSVLHNAALIREVHSYGAEVDVGKSGKSRGQHRGLGTRLIAEAERIARDEWGMKKMTIIAGVGTREYYRKFGYELKSTYMTKKLV